ncbi:MAG: hypothetical protein IT370_25505 [Deltaproteobacteria bacterium]|nr:hypothetical protein [Deltaproteobacteria bacterium]
MTLWLAVAASGCGSSRGDATAQLVPFVAVPIGSPASMMVGAAGGTLTSSDGHLTVQIPAGALGTDTPIAIQELELKDGWGWSLSPEGTRFAHPVTATMSFTTAEVGSPTMAGAHLQVPFLFASHPSTLDDPDSPLPITVDWRSAEGRVDYVAAIEHFSDLVLQKTAASWA